MSTAITEGRTIHWARFYDLGTTLFGAHFRALHRRLLDRAAVVPGERILDVGCGPGRLTLEAARAAGAAGEALGIDASPEMIALATRRAAKADFIWMLGRGVFHALSLLGLRRGTDHAEHLRALAAQAGFVRVEITPEGRAFCILRAWKAGSTH